VKDRKPRNLAASVRQRLLNRSRKEGTDFQLLFTRYAAERLLFRLGRSRYADRFLLKGAMLFALWTGQMHRPTRDLDLLGFGDSDESALAAIFRELRAMAGEEDGLEPRADTITVEPIREEQEYGGRRVTLEVLLGSARIELQIDVGFGDAVTPAPETVTYPTLLEMPPPTLRAYPRETVVAEKLETLVQLGMANSRMKDFFDLWFLAQEFNFSGERLSQAIRATFERRKTPLPTTSPVALTEVFSRDSVKNTQWQAFVRRSDLAQTAPNLAPLIDGLNPLLIPPLTAVGQGNVFTATWRKGGPWSS
jgi:predicted nucleotidyltransferase component of viral defense system